MISTQWLPGEVENLRRVEEIEFDFVEHVLCTIGQLISWRVRKRAARATAADLAWGTPYLRIIGSNWIWGELSQMAGYISNNHHSICRTFFSGRIFIFVRNNDNDLDVTLVTSMSIAPFILIWAVLKAWHAFMGWVWKPRDRSHDDVVQDLWW